MTDLTQIPVPNDGPIANKVLEIYERSFPPEEQVPMSELRRSAERDGVSFLAWIDPSLPAGEDGAGNVIALTFSFVFPDLFYLGFLAVDGRTRSAGYGSRILTHFRERYAGIPQLLETSPSHVRPRTTSSACAAWRSTSATVHGDEHAHARGRPGPTGSWREAAS